MTRVMRLKLTHRRQTRKNSEAKFSILNLKKKKNKQTNNNRNNKNQI